MPISATSGRWRFLALWSGLVFSGGASPGSAESGAPGDARLPNEAADEEAIDAAYLGYHPFKPARTNAMGGKRTSEQEAEGSERMGKGLSRSEVPESGRRREYLWEPYLFRDAPTERERAWPNINLPGPDTANFPNSAFTLPEGRFYFENSPVGYYTASNRTPAQYNWELFYRYGVTDNLEFRLFTNGFTVVERSPASLGFSPITFDLKYHLWAPNPEYAIPAVALEAYVQTTWGSPATAGGTQVAWSINVDHALPYQLALEWNLGLTKIFYRGTEVLEENASWALQRDLTEDLSLFIHGYHNAAGLPRGSTLGVDATRTFQQVDTRVFGAGVIWTWSRTAQFFGSLNGGFKGSPGFIGLAGFALAF